MLQKISTVCVLLVITLVIVLIMSLFSEQLAELKIDVLKAVGGISFFIVASVAYHVGKIPHKKHRPKYY